jgi:hypothetical protein
MSAAVPTKPPAVAFRNVFELAADSSMNYFTHIGLLMNTSDSL